LSLFLAGLGVLTSILTGIMHRMVAGQDRLLSQMRRGTLEYCVLALLRDEARYGFDLVKALGAIDGMVTSEGTLYPMLSRLRRDGLVSTTWQESPSGPPRRYYRLTQKGEKALGDFVQEWQRFRNAVDRFVEGGRNERKPAPRRR
jgi:PadR family transcriptional regulator, regulatory protein PadR